MEWRLSKTDERNTQWKAVFLKPLNHNYPKIVDLVLLSSVKILLTCNGNPIRS